MNQQRLLAFRKRRKLEEYNESATVTKLTTLIGKGDISISAAVELANSVVNDHEIPHEALAAFATLGASGNSAQNSQRDLHRWLSGLYNFRLEPYTIMLDLQASGLKVFCTQIFRQTCLRPGWIIDGEAYQSPSPTAS